jgi:membrane protease YdiL (CAAX protease family)
MTLTRLDFQGLLKDRFLLASLFFPLPVWLLIYYTDLLPLAGVELNWKVLLLIGLLFPVLEELAFRGLFQGYLLQKPVLASRSIGITGANGITSLLFAALHLMSQPVALAALIFFPSLVFGELRDRFSSTLPSILMHVYYNVGLLLVLSNKQV